MMTGALALLIFSGLLVIISIDHPFTGVVKVEPVAIFEVLEDLGRSHAVGIVLPLYALGCGLAVRLACAPLGASRVFCSRSIRANSRSYLTPAALKGVARYARLTLSCSLALSSFTAKAGCSFDGFE